MGEKYYVTFPIDKLSQVESHINKDLKITLGTVWDDEE